MEHLDKGLREIFIGIAVLSIYFDTRSKGILLFSILGIALGLVDTTGFLSNRQMSITFAVTIIPVFIYSIYESIKMNKAGKSLRISKRSLAIIAGLAVLYVLIKLFFIDRS